MNFNGLNGEKRGKDGAEWDERLKDKRAEKIGLNESGVKLKKKKRMSTHRRRKEQKIHG